jgi:tetratricopeptide (TPR) repeat protein
MKNNDKTTYNFLFNRRQEIIICIFLIVASLVVYWQITNHEFINYDDGIYVTENPHVQLGLTFKSIKWAFTTGHAANWHPLTWLSHMLDIELYGLNPMGHHWTSLQIHLINSILLFFVLKMMTGAIWKSAFVAALFALHPLHVESVAWISERKDVLSTFFLILSMWAYVRYVRKQDKKCYFLLILFFILGLMAKPMLVTLPFVLLLLDFWPLSRFQSKTKTISGLICEKFPLFALSAASCIITFFVQKNSGAVVSAEIFPLILRIANAFISYVNYLEKTLWPQNLTLLYPYPNILPLGRAILSGLLLLCISAVIFMARKRCSYLVTGWLWYIGTLVPVIGLVQVGAQSMADRYTYIPIVGIFIILTWGIADISARWRYRKILLLLFSVTALVSISICTWFQTHYWQNSKTIFTHTVNVTNNNSIAHYGLGMAYDQQGKLNKAVLHYNKALKINPNYAQAHHNLGTVLIRQDNMKAAIYHFNRALQLNPNYSKAHYNLAKVYMKLNKIESAIHYFQEALNIDSDMEIALFNLSWIYATNNKEQFRNGKEAVSLAEKLCSLQDYKYPLSLDVLATAYAEIGKFDTAVSTAEKAFKLALLYGPNELVSGINKRLSLYKSGRPYRQVPQKKIYTETKNK